MDERRLIILQRAIDALHERGALFERDELRSLLAEMIAEDQMCLHLSVDENASVAALATAPRAAQERIQEQASALRQIARLANAQLRRPDEPSTALPEPTVEDMWESLTAEADCWKCLKGKQPRGMILCPQCGNKRCPKASDHELTCTGSNEPGQPGSVY